MAENKNQKLSYEPWKGLVQGEQMVAASESAVGNLSGSFLKGFSQAMTVGLAEKKARDVKINQYIDQIGNIKNVTMIDNDVNRAQIQKFLTENRERAGELGKILYQDPYNRAAKDELEQIQLAFGNLSNQLKIYAEEKQKYLLDGEQGYLADPTTHAVDGMDYYTSIYTDEAKFTIDERGNIGHILNGKTYTYKDHVGKYNVENVLSKKFITDAYSVQVTNGENGLDFRRMPVKTSIRNHFDSRDIGVEGVQVMATQDLRGLDDEMVLADGVTVAGNMSFRQMFAQGLLDEKYYRGFEANQDGTYDTDWMMRNEEVDTLKDLMSEYYTDVLEDGHGGGKAEFTKKDNKVKQQKLNISNSIGVYSPENENITYQSLPQTKNGNAVEKGETILFQGTLLDSPGNIIQKAFEGEQNGEQTYQDWASKMPEWVGEDYVDLKLTADGDVMVAKMVDGEMVWKVSDAFDRNSDSTKIVNRYNRLINIINESADDKYYATEYEYQPVDFFYGTTKENIIDQHGAKIYNFDRVETEINFDLFTLGGNGGKLAGKLNQMYGGAGFHFWTGGRRNEAIKARYKSPVTGKEYTPPDHFMTNNLKGLWSNDVEEDKRVRDRLIAWMEKVIQQDKALTKEKKRHDREVKTFDPNE
jgi:hypothetical protein